MWFIVANQVLRLPGIISVQLGKRQEKGSLHPSGAIQSSQRSSRQAVVAVLAARAPAEPSLIALPTAQPACLFQSWAEDSAEVLP